MFGPQGGPPGGPGGMPGNMMQQSDIPPAYMMDPMTQQAVINETEFPMYLMSRPELLEPADKTFAMKQLTGIARNVFFSAVAGIALNVQIKKIKPLKIFEWNKVLRIAFRIPLFFLPFGLVINNSLDKMEELNKINHKYYIRFRKYQRTGDMKFLDPSGILFKDFQKKMNSDTINLG